MPYAPTDWNVHLGIAPPPEGTLDESQLPEVEPYGGVQLSQWGEVPIETAADFYRMAAIRRKEQEASREAAIRWQGEKQYESMIARGASPEEAFQKTAHLMYYNHPSGMAGMFRATTQKQLKEEPEIITRKDPVSGKEVSFMWDGTRYQLIPDNSAKALRATQMAQDRNARMNLQAQSLMNLKSNELPTDDSYKERVKLAKKIQDLYPLEALLETPPAGQGGTAAPLEPPTPPTGPVDARGVGPPMPGAVNPVQNVGPLTNGLPDYLNTDIAPRTRPVVAPAPVAAAPPPAAVTAPAPGAPVPPLRPFTNAPVAPPELGGPVDVDPKLQGIINLQKNEQRMLRMLEENQRRKAAESPKATNEVIRVTKDGRRAVFDAVTKEFIRYAD